MSSKVIMLLGAVLSALLIYLCLTTKKEEIAAALIPAEKKAVETIPQSVASVTPHTLQEKATKVEKDMAAEPPEKPLSDMIAPSFAYISGEKLQVTAIISADDQKNDLFAHLSSYCKSHPCDLQITTEKGRKKAVWEPEVLQILKLFEEAKIPQNSLLINDDKIIIDGVFADKADYDRLSYIEEALRAKGYRIEDRSYLQETIQAPPKAEKEIEQKANETEKKIAEILVGEPITFKIDSTELSAKSKKTLQKIAGMLDKEEGVTIEVAGYTDARGDALYNLRLSQKRAEAVKKFLLSKMKKKKEVIAKGYGATGFITNDPNDRRNRRVEIYLLKRGV
ncbi:MAG: hypothetical protein B6D59_00710 [Campylobacteraceae bacterium 4484_4]|nr:MAG: hypothetical protein B6D59_00710 [Campylobacteraceae bacterium 4484_4]